MNQHMTLIKMYDQCKQGHTYKNISDEDKNIQLGEQSYDEYKQAIINTIHHFTIKAIDIQNANIEQNKNMKVTEDPESLILIILNVMTILYQLVIITWIGNKWIVIAMREIIVGLYLF